MFVTKSLCWRHFSLCWWFFQSITNVCNLSPTHSATNIRHQHRCNRSVVMKTKSKDTLVKFRKAPQNRSCHKILVRSVQKPCWWPTFERNVFVTKIIRCKRLLSELYELASNSTSYHGYFLENLCMDPRLLKQAWRPGRKLERPRMGGNEILKGPRPWRPTEPCPIEPKNKYLGPGSPDLSYFFRKSNESSSV